MKTLAKNIKPQVSSTHVASSYVHHLQRPEQKAQQVIMRQILRPDLMQAKSENELEEEPIQAKLTIGQPNDKYEHEADHVAEQVMRMSDADVAQRVQTGKIQPMRIQRLCSKCEDEMAQRQLLEEEEEIQAKSKTGKAPEVTSAVSSGIQSLRGSGRLMSGSERSFFEPRFGADFSDVRVHNDAQAAGTAQSISARAFTLGKDVVFGKGEYSPDSSSSRKLFAHELTHVLQQNAVGAKCTSIQTKLAVDPKKFTGAKAGKRLLDFKQMIVNELQTVTGLKLEFSGNLLITKKGSANSGSKTAASVLKMAVNDSGTIFIDPRMKLGAEHTQRGIELSITSVPLRLKSMRPGIAIIHELAHHFAGSLKPPDYDKKMKALKKKADKGGTLTPKESELLLWYNQNRVQSDENIPTSVANKVRDELGLIKRTHYGFHIEYPKKPVKTGLDKFTSYTQFKTTGSPVLYIYLNTKTWDLYSSKIDYFQQLVKTGQPPTPKPSEFNKIVKNFSYYKAIRKYLL